MGQLAMKRVDLFPPTIDEMVHDALQRLMEWINRSVGQHHRYTREDFAAARIRLLGEP